MESECFTPTVKHGKGIVRIHRTPVINCYSTAREDHIWTLAQIDRTFGAAHDVSAVWGYVEGETIINEHTRLDAASKCWTAHTRTWPINPLASDQEDHS